MTVARETPTNKNVELGGRDGCKLFHYGVTSYMRPKVRRINGGWWISIARQLRIFYCFTTLICDETKKRYSKALQLLFEVHHKLRYHVLKLQINEFQNTINELLAAMIDINRPHCPSACKSIKYHWGYHWAQSRLQLGCTADEKSLERMLGESQKKFFKSTNARYDINAQMERRTMEMWVLQDLLHIAGEPPLLPDGNDVSLHHGMSLRPMLLQSKTASTLSTVLKYGLPTWLPQPCVAAIFRSVSMSISCTSNLHFSYML